MNRKNNPVDNLIIIVIGFELALILLPKNILLFIIFMLFVTVAFKI